MCECGSWDNNVWIWDVKLRSKFSWGANPWSSFNSKIKDITLDINGKDKTIWKGSSGGNYSAKDFCKAVCNGDRSNKVIWKSVSEGLVPSKVEAFCWLLHHGKLAVKAGLIRLGVFSGSSGFCLFCRQVIETIDHLFFNCIES